MHVDFVLYRHLLRHGERLAMTDRAAVARPNEVTWSGRARAIFHCYRRYAAQRAREGQWSCGRRALDIGATLQRA